MPGPQSESGSPVDLQALCDESPFLQALGVRIERSTEGIVLQTSLGSGFAVDGRGKVTHGGVVASLVDTAATFALIARSNHDWVTVDLRVDYLRPTSLGHVTVQAAVIYAGKTLGRSRAELRDETGRACAVAVGTFAPARASS
jgi:uncharacterized protein (TIGR00369 family)